MKAKLVGEEAEGQQDLGKSYRALLVQSNSFSYLLLFFFFLDIFDVTLF